MKGKLLFVVGLGVGYVLGTRAGRERYEQIARAADRVWNQPAVQQGVGAVKEFAADKLGDVSEVVLDKAKELIGNTTSKGSSPARSSASSSSSSANASSSRAATGSSAKPKPKSSSKSSSTRSSTSAASDS
ncbi:YtxH domain-containing protein [Agromyces aerolatus]|uniref:YtxH domain-containing protein n=1 Tax=Agromyces sp. LY-1074 TaxID=3074080 RepID=UPI0028556AD4|nr:MULTISPECIES: YtxH domain-containing protein [unclassified Agromyces]MDR5701631.1 YtxH domain-containing protein [Agromyces sp. LY-1074]MDR5707929.1 YtxH domain-containing protein [Agromyces sp. LY-1358]